MSGGRCKNLLPDPTSSAANLIVTLLDFMRLLLIFSFLLGACSSTPPKAQPYLPVTVRQGSFSRSPGYDFDTLTIRRDAFSLIFNSHPYGTKQKQFQAAQIVVTTNPQALARIKVGLQGADSPYLPERALASDETEYRGIMPDIEAANHYLYYDSPTDRRTELVQTRPDGTRQLEWKIAKVMVNEQAVPLADTQLRALYFAVFIDHNLNEVVEAGELAKLAVRFTD
jgi:hypothetical protein